MNKPKGISTRPRTPYPYEHNLDLHRLWRWGKGIERLLAEYQPLTEHDWQTFRPDKETRNSMVDLERASPEGLRQIREELDAANEELDFFLSSGDQSSLVDTLERLAERIECVVDAVGKSATPTKEKYLSQKEVERMFGMTAKAVKGFCNRHNIPTKQEPRRFWVALVPFATAYAQDTNVPTDKAVRKRVASAMQQQEIARRLDAATSQFFGM